MTERRVLWVDLDDMGTALFNEALRTGFAPQMKRTRNAGRRYGKFWAADMCSPFRARVMTGLDAYRPGNLVGTVIGPNQSYVLPTDATLAKGLPGSKVKRGKWHLGNRSLHPISCGFDTWSGTLQNLKPGTFFEWTKFTVDAMGNVVEELTDTYATSDTTADALKDIRDGVDFVHVSYHAIHAPLHVPPDLPPGSNYTDGDDHHLRLQMIKALDFHVGRLVGAGIRDDYVCFIACDNGTPADGKNTLYERGINTPFWVVGHGVPVGDSSRLVQATDLYSTIRLLRGMDEADTQALDSVDFVADILPGQGPPTAPRAYLSCDDFNSLGDPIDIGSWRRAVRDDRWKLIRFPMADEFFDLSVDPDEQANLVADLNEEQQAAFDQLVAQLPPVP